MLSKPAVPNKLLARVAPPACCPPLLPDQRSVRRFLVLFELMPAHAGQGDMHTQFKVDSLHLASHSPLLLQLLICR